MELDAAFAPVLLGSVESMRPLRELLTVDVAELTFIDSAGLSALIRVRDAALEDGQPLVLRAPDPQFVRLLELAGLVDAFDVEKAAD